MLGWFAIDDVRGWVRNLGGAMSDGDRVIELDVQGMSCGGCASKLDGFLWKVDGVSGVTVSQEEGRATIRGSASQDALIDAVRAAGFTPAV